MWKLTVPRGVPAPGDTAATVATRETWAPGRTGLDVVTKLTELAALLTTWLTLLAAEVAKFSSPTYTAVIPWVATLREETVMLAVPELRLCVPIGLCRLLSE
jgi:hypothetical protein